ncbi:MAG: lipopolysaccharide kinase InaA family protein [Gemmobacter sp.]
MSYQSTTTGPALSAAMRRALDAALETPPQRVRPVRAGGRMIWLKQAERLSLRWRIQKGDSVRAFEADRRALHILAAAGLPVAPIVAEGADYFATRDVGEPMSAMLRDETRAGADRIAAFAAAGAALAQLHSAGFAHGRPSIRDICWDGRQATLIDFERFSTRRNGHRRMATDALILFHSICTYGGGQVPELGAAAMAWKHGVPPDVVRRLRRQARILSVLMPMVRLGLALRPRSRELRAVPATLDFLRQF